MLIFPAIPLSLPPQVPLSLPSARPLLLMSLPHSVPSRARMLVFRDPRHSVYGLTAHPTPIHALASLCVVFRAISV